MMNFGGYEILEHKGTVELPQDAASAWANFDGGKTGVSYKPVAYIAKNTATKGVNHLFFVEQTIILEQPERHYVFVEINEFNGKYAHSVIERYI